MSQAQAASFFKEKFSLKAFYQGLAVVLAAYFLLFSWALLNADKTLQRQQDRLASQTAIIKWPVPETDTAQESAQEQAQDSVHTLPADGTAVDEKHLEAPSTAQTSAQHIAGVKLLESGLADAPVDGLYEVTADGHLPLVRSRDGLTPFKAYRRPFDLQAVNNRPVIAIGIAGLGLSNVALESALRSMPGEVSFIFSPYSPTPDFWIREARARGHEVWLTLPVEPENYPQYDPGPHTMLIGAPERENLTKLDWVMSRTDGYVGFVTNPQPAFMKSANDMRPVVGNIYHRGLALIDGSADPGTIAQSMAVGMKAAYGTVDLWVDRHTATQEGLDKALIRLEETAQNKGYAVGIIHTLPVSYQELLKWLKTLPDKGIVLAPLSATTGY